ncbi:EscU/YscU/HrcU family type III secretion system export apparatus switch protein [Shigella flexneri]
MTNSNKDEGNPHVKGRIRQMQRAAARRRMMADVPKATLSSMTRTTTR